MSESKKIIAASGGLFWWGTLILSFVSVSSISTGRHVTNFSYSIFIFYIIPFFRLDIHQLHSNKTELTLHALFEFLLSCYQEHSQRFVFDQEKTASYVVMILNINCSDINKGVILCCRQTQLQQVVMLSFKKNKLVKHKDFAQLSHSSSQETH